MALDDSESEGEEEEEEEEEIEEEASDMESDLEGKKDEGNHKIICLYVQDWFTM